MKAKILLLFLLLIFISIPTTIAQYNNLPTLSRAEAEVYLASASCSFVSNPGFELGPVGWSQTGSQQVWELPDDAWSGNWLMWQCGYDSCADRIWQTVDLSGYKDPVLFLFWKLESQDMGRPYDVFSGYVLDEAGGPLYGLFTFSNLATPKGRWNWESWDLSDLGLDNSRFQLSFTGVTDQSRPTSFYLDDVLICARSLEMAHLPVVIVERW